MNVLFASRYVNPTNPRTNHNIINQVRGLKKICNVEVLTWPSNDLWDHEIPLETPNTEPLELIIDNIVFKVISAPNSWNEVAGGNIISDEAWESAVNYGIDILLRLKPDIFHLHHRMGFWWLLESAQRLGIPTVYTNYDWGIACLRTTLVTGTGELCNGIVNPEKCSKCIRDGRKKPMARINEKVVEFDIGETILGAIEKCNYLNQIILSKNIVTRSAFKRTFKHQQRLFNILTKLDHIFTPSEFGKKFFSQFGVRNDRISKLTWPYDRLEETFDVPLNDQFIITFIGRVSPDKGVHLIFEALENLPNLTSICLRILGINDSEYCINLQNKYPNKVNQHTVEWVQWSEIKPYLASTDALIIPSIWMDNTPLTLIEAIVYKVPIIAPSLPSISEYLENGVGYMFNFNDSVSLSKAIQTAYSEIKKKSSTNTIFPKILSVNEYAIELMKIYKSICIKE